MFVPGSATPVTPVEGSVPTYLGESYDDRPSDGSVAAGARFIVLPTGTTYYFSGGAWKLQGDPQLAALERLERLLESLLVEMRAVRLGLAEQTGRDLLTLAEALS